MKSRKSWQSKMDNPGLPKLVDIPAGMQKRFGAGTMLIPSPRQVEALIRNVPEGGLMTVSKLRESLAGQHGADVACPLTTGMFVRLAAEAAEESARAGEDAITPYWRIVKDDGSLNPKFPGGVKHVALADVRHLDQRHASALRERDGVRRCHRCQRQPFDAFHICI